MNPGRGQTILILGIVSIVCCQLLGPLAWIWGKQDLAKIKAGEIDREAEQLTKIGMILGIVGSVLLVLNLIFVCIYGIIIGLAAASGKMKTGLDIYDAIASVM